MDNFEIRISLADDSEIPWDYDTGEELMGELVHDTGAPAKGMKIVAFTEDRKRVDIYIPNSKLTKAHVTITEEEP